MLNIDEINKEIERLEKCDCTTYGVCQKLANLYIVRDHFKGDWSEKKSPVADGYVKTNAMVHPITAETPKEL